MHPVASPGDDDGPRAHDGQGLDEPAVGVAGVAEAEEIGRADLELGGEGAGQVGIEGDEDIQDAMFIVGQVGCVSGHTSSGGFAVVMWLWTG